jgi:methylamine dehydrogenase accessory protein MauD
VEKAWLVSYVLAWLLVAAQGLTLVALLWVVGQIHLKRSPDAHALITTEGPEIHSLMPEIEGLDHEGRWIRGRDFRGRNLVLLLLSPGCAPCEQLLREVQATQRGLTSCPEFLAVIEAPGNEAESYLRRYRLNFPVIVDEDASIRAGLRVTRTPFAFLIDQEGVVRMKGVVNNRGQLEGLISRRGRYIGGLVWETEDDLSERGSAEQVEPAFPGKE